MCPHKKECVPAYSTTDNAYILLPDQQKISIHNEVVIGRKTFNTIVPPETAALISSKHAKIWIDGDKYYIVDGCEGRASTNGTKLNGKQIKGLGKQQLLNNDLIELADKTKIQIKIPSVDVMPPIIRNNKKPIAQTPALIPPKIKTPKNNSFNKKVAIIAIIISVIIIISAISVAFYTGTLQTIINQQNNGNNNGNNNQNNNVFTDILVYDPTGNNIKRQTTGICTADEVSAYLINITNGNVTKKTPVKVSSTAFPTGMDTNAPMIVSGKFETSSGSSGSTIIDKITPIVDQTINDGSFNGYKFKNVKAHLSSVSIVIKQHTFGFGYGRDGEPIVYISIDKKPTFFTNVTIDGVVLPKNIGEMFDFLDMNLSTELTQFQDAFKGFGKSAEISNFSLGATIILADHIEYDNSMVLNGDIIDIITPTDINNFITALNPDIDSSNYKFITDILSQVNMELIIMVPTDIKINSLDFWFIVGITDLYRGKTHGLVNCNVTEITQQNIEQALNIKIPDISLNPHLSIHYGVTGDSDNKTSLKSCEVTDYWSLMGNSTATASYGVSTNGFALVMTVNDVCTYMNTLFNMDTTTLTRLTTVRNPGVGLFIDENFTEVFDNSNKPFTHYLALILIPDFQLNSQQLMYLVHVNGVLYDLGKFLNNPSWTFPVVIADSVSEGAPPVSYTLKNIYDGALDNKLVTPIETEGFATGTTMKTIAYYTPFCPVSQAIDKSPIDIGAYDVYSPETDGYRYHTALIGFNLTKDTGPTYVFHKVKIDGFYINLATFVKRIKSALNLGNDLGIGSLIWEIIGIVEQYTGNRILSGAILGYKIIPIQADSNVPVTDFHAYTTVVNTTTDESSLYIEGNVTNMGSIKFPLVARMIIKSVAGKILFRNVTLACSSDVSWFPNIILLPGGTAYFRLDERFNSNDLPPGNYHVDVYILDWLDGNIQDKLGEAHGDFKVIDSPDSLGIFYSGVSYIGIGVWNVHIHFSTDDSKALICSTPNVIHWSNVLVALFGDVSLMSKEGTYWNLEESWALTGNFHIVFIANIQMDNQIWELRTNEYLL